MDIGLHRDVSEGCFAALLMEIVDVVEQCHLIVDIAYSVFMSMAFL